MVVAKIRYAFIVYDGYPVRLRGMAGVSRARVIWHDGRLYVARSVNDVVSVAADEPTRSARGYATGSYRWHQFGCSSCSARTALAKASAEDLMAKATPVDQPEPETSDQGDHGHRDTHEGLAAPVGTPTSIEPASDRATCPECGREGVKVNRDGSLRKHGCGDSSPGGD